LDSLGGGGERDRERETLSSVEEREQVREDVSEREKERERERERVRAEERERADMFVLETSLWGEGERERGWQQQLVWEQARERERESESTKAKERARETLSETREALSEMYDPTSTLECAISLKRARGGEHESARAGEALTAVKLAADTGAHAQTGSSREGRNSDFVCPQRNGLVSRNDRDALEVNVFLPNTPTNARCNALQHTSGSGQGTLEITGHGQEGGGQRGRVREGAGADHDHFDNTGSSSKVCGGGGGGGCCEENTGGEGGY